MAGKSKGKQFARLYSLGESKMRRITEEMAKPNASPTLCAKMIQEEWGDYLDVSHQTLAQQLNRFRLAMYENKLPKPVKIGKLRLEAMNPMVPPEAVGAEDVTGLTKPRSNPLNFLDELNHLATLQMERVEAAIAREKTLGMPVTQTDGIIKNLRETLVAAQQIKFELGIDTYMMPAPGGKTISATVTTPEGTMVNMQVTEAVQEATSILDRLANSRGVTRIIDSEDD
jgi:hypothetical protein